MMLAPLPRQLRPGARPAAAAVRYAMRRRSIRSPRPERLEFFVGLVDGQALGQRAEKAGNHPVISSQSGSGLGPGVAAGQPQHANHPRMGDELLIEVVDLGQSQLHG